MHKITTMFFLAGAALATSFGALAQSTPGSGDMSRYESIYDAPKPVRGQAKQVVPKSITPGKNVETIGPSVGYSAPISASRGISQTLQPIVRPSISMNSGGEGVSRAPSPAPVPPPDKVEVPALTKNAPAIITEEANAKSGVINGVMVTR